MKSSNEFLVTAVTAQEPGHDLLPHSATRALLLEDLRVELTLALVLHVPDRGVDLVILRAGHGARIHNVKGMGGLRRRVTTGIRHLVPAGGGALLLHEEGRLLLHHLLHEDLAQSWLLQEDLTEGW